MTQRDLLPRTIAAAALGAAVLTAPALAQAGEINVSLAEDHDGVTVRVRGLPEGARHDQVVTSRHGALLFVPAGDVAAQRLRPLDRHRLDFVQVGRAGERVAVRVVQRKNSRGTLVKHLHAIAVPGGLDLRIDDRPPAAAPTTVAPPAATTAANTLDRSAALARIADGPVAPAPVAAAVAAPPASPAAATVSAPPPAVEAAASAPPVATATPRDEGAAAGDDTPRWAAASSTADNPLPLQRTAPQIGLAWLATALLAFSGMGLLWWRRRRPQAGPPAALQIIAKVAIGPKQQVLWLSAGGRALLVGATEHRIELIADLSAATAPATAATANAAIVNAAITAATPSPAAARPDAAAPGKVAAFKQRLRAALGDEIAGRNDEPALPPHLDLLASDPRWAARKDAA
ncbi:MAG: flagellar biosynthetic protein FliO [Nannocystaceae bacterium]|nr:flagellar biosynthetic protein FliO [Nannocystaceae bacterium]